MHGAKAGVSPCVSPKKVNVRVECKCGMRHAGCGRRTQVWHKMWMWQSGRKAKVMRKNARANAAEEHECGNSCGNIWVGDLAAKSRRFYGLGQNETLVTELNT